MNLGWGRSSKVLDARGENVLGKLGKEEGRGGGGEMLPTLGRGRGGGIWRGFSLYLICIFVKRI